VPFQTANERSGLGAMTGTVHRRSPSARLHQRWLTISSSDSSDSVFTDAVSWAAELGRQLALIHVETPNRGRIHACRAIHRARKPRMKSSDSMLFPPVFIATGIDAPGWAWVTGFRTGSDMTPFERPLWGPARLSRPDRRLLPTTAFGAAPYRGSSWRSFRRRRSRRPQRCPWC
jgi:hypothetical protein